MSACLPQRRVNRFVAKVLFQAFVIACVQGLILDYPLFAQETPSPQQAIARGVAFLAEEVPAWRSGNGCYSCHNNGNAAQALYRAKSRGLDVADNAVADTTEWLMQPQRWKDNGGDPAFADETLANIQFAAALVTAIECEIFPDQSPEQTAPTRDAALTSLRTAAELLAADQQPDGFWRIGGEKLIGAPATLGNTLATREALRTLRMADRERYAKQIAKAEAWLLAERPQTVLDSSSLLLAMSDLRAADKSASRKANDSDLQTSEQQTNQRQHAMAVAANHALAIVRKGQSSDGGFGPYVIAQPESFDTAIALLALSRWAAKEDRERIAAARDFLLQEQQKAGDWPETTRPSGRESYAQRLSTAGWAVLALLETKEEVQKP